MPAVSQSDTLLIDRIRAGENDAWDELIGRFEGRLLAFVETRLRDRSTSEDVVQETFIGFLTSLPNYDIRRPLESYLFSIAAHKLTDQLRRQGRRPALPLIGGGPSGEQEWDVPGSQRAASSLVRSGERRHLEEAALVQAMTQLLAHWRTRGDWEKIECTELLFVRGVPNKDAAAKLGISEQTVANYKFDFLAKLRVAVRQQGLPEEVFPELYDAS
ncbi:MAG: RNA polymerase subunit sigma-70 [Planctomycetia bacterium 21-64-5]|nr:MAG: RNA polymerase subunit sigma-70 [Planctomycetia bacterium 21-64-5]HQU42042.1 RNA polymerase sigma factor [Pirellulales bacterium]